MIDESSLSTNRDSLTDAKDEINYLANMDEKLLQSRQQEKEQVVQDKQEVATQQDARDNPEGWGLKGLAKEAQSILSGGLQDTASSIATLPERTADMLSGEMQREKEETGQYTPDWDPFQAYENPIETKTWWGKLLRGVVHFGSLSLIPMAGWKTIAGKAAYYGTNSLVRAAAIGAGADLISKDSDGQNALGMLRDRYGWMDTPLSTNDADHPLMLKFKNVVEGMGIGLVFDGASMILSKGTKAGAVTLRSNNIKDQTIEKGLQELREGELEFRAAKNKPIAQQHQGAYTSEQTVGDAYRSQKKTRENWGSEEGSTGSIIRPILTERAAKTGKMPEEVAENILKGLYSDFKFQQTIQDLKDGNRTLMEAFGDSIEAHQRITLGRNAAEMPAEEYLEEILKASDTYDVTDSAGNVIDTITTITSQNVIVTDLITGTLIKQLRDTGISGRELAEYFDLGAIDGPAKQVADTLMTALTEAKRARVMKSTNFRELGAGKARKYIEEQVSKDMVDTRDSIMSILQIAKDDPSDELLNALFEVFSSMKTVNNLDDFDSWARKIIKGGQLEPKGPERTGALIRELQGMFTHSVLSGPKTPMRAIMGTSMATFLRPFSIAIGGAMRYPFTGDAVTMRAGLASLNAMREAIPEAFEVFRTKLNSYWSGDVSSIKTRFTEFTRGDENWELLRRYYEDSGRASTGDKALFAMANMARNANNSNYLTYSTKLMAATDDAFAHILGRAKMREKAFRSAMDSQSAGRMVDIQPELLRKFEDDFYQDVFDPEGNIKDEATKFARKEVTLTQDLTGFSKGLNDVFSSNPWARPFFLFARTGVNGLALTAKHTPGFNFLVKEFNEIAFASVDNLTDVHKYGIFTPEELANAKALQTGRLGIGSAVVFMAGQAFLEGKITGNGPTDRSKRQMWKDAGYIERSIKLGDVWISYDSIEPFNQILSLIADIGDNSLLMGDEWTEDQFQKTALVIAQGLASKSYLAGMQQFVELFSGKPGQSERIIASLLNNQVPLSSLRNDLGKLFTPYTRELASGVDQSLRNRNLSTEYLAGEELPIKYDLLTGRPIKDHDFMTRAFNMFSPMHFNLDYSPGKQFLFESGYDLRIATYFSPEGDDLSEYPEIRSKYQRAIGLQNLELKLSKLSRRRDVQESLQQMYFDIRSGKRADNQASEYLHNILIDDIFDAARQIAWTTIIDDPVIAKLQQERNKKALNKRNQYMSAQTILNMYK
jgi:hypothetical protein